ncbi:MAG: DUF2378 family protein [Myxococcales bacterium]|nr:DUF2378 family protein [Myxococcales bacterium]
MDFEPFDATAPYDVQPVVNGTPADHHVRGMMFNRLQRALRESGRRIPFKLYPLRDYNALIVRAAETLYPGSTIGEGLWNVGAFAVKAFGESMAGRTFFTLADGDFTKGLRRLPNAYDLVQDHAV